MDRIYLRFKDDGAMFAIVANGCARQSNTPIEGGAVAVSLVARFA